MLIPKGQGGKQYATGNRDYVVTWGARTVIHQAATGGEGTAAQDTEQLVYVANEVPETFSVFFLVRLLEGSASTVNVTFTVTIGVGTSRVMLPYGIILNAALGAPVEQYDNLQTPQAVGWIMKEFPAQQLNVVANVQVNGSTVPVTVEVVATTAPRFKEHRGERRRDMLDQP